MFQTTALSIMFSCLGLFMIWAISLFINFLIIAIITAPDIGPFGVDNRIYEMILERDYLSLESRDNITRLVRFGGFFLWIFFLYVAVRDLIKKHQ